MNRWKRLFHHWQREKELDEEIQTHLRMATQERMEQGETAEQARPSAVREFGNIALVKEVTRDMWGFRWLEALLQDLRYGARQLHRNPGFTVVAILTLALGIGGNVAVFSLLDTVLLRPLPYAHPERLYMFFPVDTKVQRAQVESSYPNFQDWREQSRAFEAMAGVPRRILQPDRHDGTRTLGWLNQYAGALRAVRYFAVIGARI